jgi:tetratricopeptide (TPR) repeat protein
MTAADKYYLKARDNYPYNLEEALEALDYGLSCDDTHAGLLTLQGNIYFKDLKQFSAAKDCFELAIFHDVLFVDTYYAYIEFALAMNNYKKAEKLITQALQVNGIEKARVLYLHALLFEKQDVYADAINQLKLAKQHCDSKESYSFLAGELERLQAKNTVAEEHQKKLNVVFVK